MTRPTYGSLFSGVGGMDMGFDTYMDCVFQVEWDKHAQSILRRHWPDVPKWGDVQEVNGADLPPCDVLTFGSPCQDLSVAGKRAGLDGGRSSMFYEAIRIIKEMRDATSSRPTGPLPRIAVWENVPGALSSNGGKDFGVVLDEMAQLGAVEIEWRVLDAQHFGVPQRRRRVFVVAIFDPATANRCPNPLLPVSEGRRGDFTKGRKKGQEVAGTIGGGSGSRGWSPDTDRMTFIPVDANGQWAAGSENDTLRQSITSKWSTGYSGPSGDEYHNLAVVPFVKARRAQNDTDDETWVEGEVTPTLNAFDNGGESRATVLMPVAYSIREDAKANTFSATETDTALCLNGLVPSPQSHHAQIFIAEPIIFENSYRDGIRINDGISHCLPAKMGTGGGNQPHVAQPITFEPETVGPLTSTGMSRARGTESVESSHVLAVNTLAVRRLTPLECERLMGWPDDHTRYTDTGKEQSDSNRYKQCGNGVATPVARWIAKHITPLLSGNTNDI